MLRSSMQRWTQNATQNARKLCVFNRVAAFDAGMDNLLRLVMTKPAFCKYEKHKTMTDDI